MGDVLSERVATVLSAQAEFNEGQIETVASEVAVQIFKSSGHIEIRRNGLVDQIGEIHSLDRKSVQLILNDLLRHDLLVRYLRGEDEYLAFKSASAYSYYLTER